MKFPRSALGAVLARPTEIGRMLTAMQHLGRDAEFRHLGSLGFTILTPTATAVAMSAINGVGEALKGLKQ